MEITLDYFRDIHETRYSFHTKEYNINVDPWNLAFAPLSNRLFASNWLERSWPTSRRVDPQRHQRAIESEEEYVNRIGKSTIIPNEL